MWGGSERYATEVGFPETFMRTAMIAILTYSSRAYRVHICATVGGPLMSELLTGSTVEARATSGDSISIPGRAVSARQRKVEN
jgi:hypothetical protein